MYHDLHGIPAYRENRGVGEEFFFVLFCSYPESYNYKKKIKKREKSSGERRWLLTCLMVRFPSSIQPARAAHSALLSARQKSINFPTVEQVSLPPLSCRLFPPPALFILGRGEPWDNVKFPKALFCPAYGNGQRGRPAGSDFKPSQGWSSWLSRDMRQPRQSAARGGRLRAERLLPTPGLGKLSRI